MVNHVEIKKASRSWVNDQFLYDFNEDWIYFSWIGRILVGGMGIIAGSFDFVHYAQVYFLIVGDDKARLVFLFIGLMLLLMIWTWL